MAVPIGGIIWWSGAAGAIPANYHVCDGTGGTIDLRDKFVPCAGSGYAVAATGGAASYDLTHTHGLGTMTATSQEYNPAGTVAQKHVHSITMDTTRQFASGMRPVTDPVASEEGADGHYHIWSKASAGFDQTPDPTHVHDVVDPMSTDGGIVDNRPPYMALYFIQRMS